MKRRHLLLAALALAGAGHIPEAAASLETRRIGRRRASLREGRDVFAIGGPLAALDVRIRNGSLWIDRVEFVFADGSMEVELLRRRVPMGGMAAAMARDGRKPKLRQVAIHHANLPVGPERPVIEIWGRPALAEA
jgi:hypothetical protein